MEKVNEFSTENLLFIYEYIQIKYEFQMECNRLLKLPKPKSKVARMHRKSRKMNRQSSAISNASSMITDEDKEPEEFITVDFHVEDKRIDRRSRTSSLWNNYSIRTSSGIASYIFNNNGSIFARIELPANLPKSQLLKLKEKFLDRLYALYCKYVKRGSILEINISCIQRKRITKSFDKILDKINIDEEIEQKDSRSFDSHDELKIQGRNDSNSIRNINDNNHKQQDSKMDDDERKELEMNMFTCMDGACIEILLLMSQSYTRFTKSEYGINIPIVEKLTNVNDDIELIDYRKRALSMEILRNGSSYSKLNELYNPHRT